MSATAMSRAARATAGAAGLLMLAACVPASSIQPVASMSEIGDGEVVVVGRITLDPPLAPGEQDVGGYEEYRDMAILVTDTELRPGPTLELNDFKRSVDAPLGEYFHVRMPAEPFYILRGWIIVGIGTHSAAGKAPLDGQFAIDVQPDDRAIYIGDIRYRRDEFFGTVEVAVTDRYDDARARFRETFGSGVTLRRALVAPVRPPAS